MGEVADLKALETKVWTSYFKDGLWEIVIGTILMVSVLSSTLDAAGVGDDLRVAIYLPLMIVLPVLVFVLGKRYITLPRLGAVKFAPERLVRRLRVFLGILLVMLLNLAAWGAGALSPGTVAPYFSIIVPLDVFLVFCIMAYYFDHALFYLVGVLLALAEVAVQLLKSHTDIVYYGLIAYGIPAAILLAVGGTMLARFMLAYRPEGEAGDAR